MATSAAEQRRRRILEVVRARGSIRVADLAGELGVAIVTARRDVALLATQGLLRHGHGSATWPDHPPVPPVGPTAPVLGMPIPLATHYFAEVIRGARAACAAAGARLLLAPANRLPEVDGLLLPPGAEEIRAPDVPCVLVEHRPAPPTGIAAGLDRVRSEHAYGACLAVRHLTGLGHRRIALAVQDGPAGAEVRGGYRAALGAPPPVPVIDTNDLDTDPIGLHTAADQLLAAVREHGVTAALIHNDVDAIMLIQRLAVAGVRVPEDLSVIAYDDEVAAFADIPLTAIQPPKREVGRVAVNLLLRRIAERPADWSPRRHLDLLPRLTVRRSCARSGFAAHESQ